MNDPITSEPFEPDWDLWRNTETIRVTIPDGYSIDFLAHDGQIGHKPPDLTGPNMTLEVKIVPEIIVFPERTVIAFTYFKPSGQDTEEADSTILGFGCRGNRMLFSSTALALRKTIFNLSGIQTPPTPEAQG